MKWSKIKSLMVCFLIVMNLFMLAIIAVTTWQQSTIPEKVLDAAISFLNKSGFEFDNELFPDTYYSLPSYNAHFYSASELSDLFFGKQVAFRTEGNSLVATQDNAVLTVNDNNFIYNSGYDAVKAESSKIKSVLKKMGINMKGAVYDEKTSCFYRMYNNTNLFNMSLEARLDGDGDICYLKAQWPKTLTAEEPEKLSFIESTMKLKEAFPDGGTITKIELGYSLQQISGGKFVFTPAWRVMVNDELKILN